MNTSKPWLVRAVSILRQNLSPVATEPNELDWKSGLSSNKERLIEHLSAFGNQSGGGFLAFGIDNSTATVAGVTQEAVETSVNQLANHGRDALEPPIAIDHVAVELFGLPPVAFVQAENAFKVILYAPRKFADMSQSERIEACYQHAVLKYLSSGAMTNTSLRERFKLAESQRSPISRLIRDALEAGRIRRKDPHATSSKFTEYLPYWG